MARRGPLWERAGNEGRPMKEQSTAFTEGLGPEPVPLHSLSSSDCLCPSCAFLDSRHYPEFEAVVCCLLSSRRCLTGVLLILYHLSSDVLCASGSISSASGWKLSRSTGNPRPHCCSAVMLGLVQRRGRSRKERKIYLYMLGRGRNSVTQP